MIMSILFYSETANREHIDNISKGKLGEIQERCMDLLVLFTEKLALLVVHSNC